ncbi:unnamed protein product [Closterium sp. NIES-53]
MPTRTSLVRPSASYLPVLQQRNEPTTRLRPLPCHRQYQGTVTCNSGHCKKVCSRAAAAAAIAAGAAGAAAAAVAAAATAGGAGAGALQQGVQGERDEVNSVIGCEAVGLWVLFSRPWELQWTQLLPPLLEG